MYSSLAVRPKQRTEYNIGGKNKPLCMWDIERLVEGMKGEKYLLIMINLKKKTYTYNCRKMEGRS